MEEEKWCNSIIPHLSINSLLFHVSFFTLIPTAPHVGVFKVSWIWDITLWDGTVSSFT